MISKIKSILNNLLEETYDCWVSGGKKLPEWPWRNLKDKARSACFYYLCIFFNTKTIDNVMCLCFHITILHEHEFQIEYRQHQSLFNM